MTTYADSKDIWLETAVANAEEPDEMNIQLEEYAKQGTSIIELNRRMSPFGVEQEELCSEEEEEERLFGTSIRSAIKIIRG